MIEEIRILTTSVGRSIPQALFDVGLRGPLELRPAFASEHPSDLEVLSQIERRIQET